MSELTEITVPTPAKAAAKDPTEYVVLLADGEGARERWGIVGRFTARSSAAAITLYADKSEEFVYQQEDGITLVAIPARSWKPVKVTPKVERSLKVEEVSDGG